MQQILASLTQSLSDFSPQMRRAAGRILDNPGAVAVNSMRAMAGAAEVSPPTMLRLAQRLGFESYETFRDVFKSSIAGTDYSARAADLNRSAHEDGVPGLLRDTVAASAGGLERLTNPAFAMEVERIAQMVASAPITYIVASGALFGHAVSFQYVLRMAMPGIVLAWAPGLDAVNCLAPLNERDAVVAITMSPYARATIDAADMAKCRGAAVAAITDSRSSPLARIADAALTVTTQSPHYFPSTVGLTAALEALSAAIAIHLGDAAVTALGAHEQGLRDSGYYWQAPR